MPRPHRRDPFRRRPELEVLEERNAPTPLFDSLGTLPHAPAAAATAQVRPGSDTNYPPP